MAKALIPEGYILVSRKLVHNIIFSKPHLYIKVWIYLLSKAQHKDYKGLKRGQLWTSIPEIQAACSYYVGFRKEVPTKKQIFDILEWLRSSYEADTTGTMITTMKGTQGILVTIENYAFYQDKKNYERNDDSNDEEPMKEMRGEQYKQECKRMNISIDHFDAFWRAYPKKKAKAAAEKAFMKLKVDESLLNIMVSAIELQKQSKQWQDMQFIPNSATWLNQRRWEDEEIKEQQGVELQRTAAGSYKF